MPTQQLQKIDDKKIVKSIESSALEWGLRSNGRKLMDHMNFERLAIDAALRHFAIMDSPGSTTTEKSLPKIPNDLLEAIKHVLRSELVDRKPSMFVITDKLDNKYDEPFTVAKSGELIKKKYFKKYSEEMLDPLTRFEKLELSFVEYWFFDFHDWGVCTSLAFEGIVSSFAVYNIPCENCKALKTLNWCGGSASSWCDMTCHHCNSSYEIKSKRNKESIAKLHRFESGSFGGSFLAFCRQKSAYPESRHYIVHVSRKPEVLRTKGIMWPVEIEEILFVLPVLCPLSFSSTTGEISFKGKYRMKEKTKRIWFHAPWFLFDAKKIARKVFEEVFPGQWDLLSRRHFEPKTSESAVTNLQTDSIVNEDQHHNQTSSKSVDAALHTLTEAVSSIKVGSDEDDWEKCYESD